MKCVTRPGIDSIYLQHKFKYVKDLGRVQSKSVILGSGVKTLLRCEKCGGHTKGFESDMERSYVKHLLNQAANLTIFKKLEEPAGKTITIPFTKYKEQ